MSPLSDLSALWGTLESDSGNLKGPFPKLTWGRQAHCPLQGRFPAAFHHPMKEATVVSCPAHEIVDWLCFELCVTWAFEMQGSGHVLPANVFWFVHMKLCRKAAIKEPSLPSCKACMLPIGTQEQNIMGVDETEATQKGRGGSCVHFQTVKKVEVSVTGSWVLSQICQKGACCNMKTISMNQVILLVPKFAVTDFSWVF